MFGACIAAALLAYAVRPVFAASFASAKEPLAASRASRAAAPSAIVVPRSSCGTSWTVWVKDPNADLNPCPKGCERGKRLQLDEHKSGDTTEYQANYECYLPQLAVPQPALKARATGAPPRQNCGTMWTGWQSDPSSPANPCPANCERGELRAVNRSLSNGKLVFDMNYRCYVKEPESAKPSATPGKQPATAGASAQAVSVTTPALQMTGKRPVAIGNSPSRNLAPEDLKVTTPALQMTGKRSIAVASRGAGLDLPPVKVVTPALQMTGKRLPSLGAGAGAGKELSAGSVAITTPALEMTGRRPPSPPVGRSQAVNPAMGEGPPRRR